MNKTLKSRAFDAMSRKELWERIAEDDKALEDRNKTRSEALILASYFEGVYDGLIQAIRGEGNEK